VLDLMLPKLDGLEVCRLLRTQSNVPIIMLTARDEELDKVVGLEVGADDYITKPFSVREFRSRVRALLRRAAHGGQSGGRDLLCAAGVEIDLAKRTVRVRESLIGLTYVEFELLRTMAAAPGRVFTRRALLEALWGGHAYREMRTIDVHVRHLREKIETRPHDPELILTVRGVGYCFAG
jgi:DNA-binding response OmpR family regulator